MLFLFSALSRRVSDLQMSIIIIVVVVAVVVRRTRSNPRKKCHKKDENYDNSAIHLKLKRSCSREFYRPLRDVYALRFPG